MIRNLGIAYTSLNGRVGRADGAAKSIQERAIVAALVRAGDDKVDGLAAKVHRSDDINAENC